MKFSGGYKNQPALLSFPKPLVSNSTPSFKSLIDTIMTEATSEWTCSIWPGSPWCRLWEEEIWVFSRIITSPCPMCKRSTFFNCSIDYAPSAMTASAVWCVCFSPGMSAHPTPCSVCHIKQTFENVVKDSYLYPSWMAFIATMSLTSGKRRGSTFGMLASFAYCWSWINVEAWSSKSRLCSCAE